MTDFRSGTQRARDQQDHFERHVWGELEYVDGAGAKIRVKGTDTEDLECAVLNIGGVSFNLPPDSNTEVFLLSGGADTNQKYAVITIPRDKQRKWAEGTGGVQHPNDPDRALEINDKRAWITSGDFATGAGGVFEVRGDTVYIRGNVVVEGTATVNTEVLTPTVNAGTAPVPGFDV